MEEFFAEEGLSGLLAADPAAGFEPAGERIGFGVWRPGLLEAHAARVAAGMTTRLLARPRPGGARVSRLRVTADPRRVIAGRDELAAALRGAGQREDVEAFRARKLVAGLHLVRMLRQLDRAADPRRMVKTRLVHGTDVVVVDEAYLARAPSELVRVAADGLVTDLPRTPLLVAAADCASVFVYDAARGVVGLGHAGWRGTYAGLPGAIVRCLSARYGSRAADLRVVVGPHADGERYDVGAEVRGAFCRDADRLGLSVRDLGVIFRPHPKRPGAWLFDNGSALRAQFVRLGVMPDHVEVSRYSTMRDRGLFASERVEGPDRRDTNVSMIVLH
jgi:YfiH family protein